jgi:hypothetical protein
MENAVHSKRITHLTGLFRPDEISRAIEGMEDGEKRFKGWMI